ncbi:anti-sigma factor domain-containing protein [Hydrogenophaga sp.]|uniref:anti-sigma factor domain-containing protein n=1 Tax=Hydrogenophaga sp. TaxID=1904254 RepID=UPI00351E613A
MNSPSPRTGVSPWWRIASVVLMIALLLAWATSASMFEQLKAQISHLQGRLDQTSQVRFVSVLQDNQNLPAMLITHDPQQGVLLVQRLNDVREGREDSMQIWAIAGDAAPRSLGVVESKYQTFQMPVAADALEGATEIGVSAENRGGVSAATGPSLPWLFKGWWIKKSV